MLKMNAQECLVLLTFLASFGKLCDCWFDKYAIQSRLATKTAYQFLNSSRLDSLVNITELNSLKLCSADGLTMILRHGSRNPGKSNINSFSKLHAKLLRVMPENKIPLALKQWKNPFTIKTASQLLQTGKLEHETIAAGVKKVYDSPITTKDTIFMSSDVTRAIESGEAFMKGLFGSTSALPMKINDPMIRFYEHCPRYVKEVEDNPSAFIEYDKFKKSSMYKKQTDLFTNRLSLSESLTSDELENLFYVCAHEIAANISQHWSPWCDLLDESDVPIINYGADLKEYYSSGYGHPINYLSSCTLIRHVVNELSNKTKTHSFIFGHSQTVLPVLSILGFFNDSVKLTANTFNDRWLFQMQTIGVFATNVLFKKYKCPNENETAIVVYVNENPVSWSNGKVKMPLTQLKQMVFNICGSSEDEDAKRCTNESVKVTANFVTLFSMFFVVFILGCN